MDGHAPVVVLAGWGTGTERLQPILDELRDAGHPAHQHAYTPSGSIRGLGADLAAATPPGAHLVGHSLGGLIGASAVLDHGAPAASVTTINAPWRGTWAAWTAQDDDPLGRQLRWGADELRRLRDALADHLSRDRGPRWCLLAAALDPAVPPTSSLRTPGGDRLRRELVAAVGHSLSLQHRSTVRAVTAAIGAARARR